MNSQMTLLELPENRTIFRNLFNIAYGTKEPILPLERIMHWQTVKENLPVQTPELDKTQTLVLGGFFYNFSTPLLTATEITSGLGFGREQKVTQFLIPTVRDDIDDGLLLEHGFKKIPWFVESIFDIESDVDTDLRARVGAKRSRELSRLAEKAAQSYSYEWLDAKRLQATPELIRQIAELHQQNIEKYRHTVNLYPSEVLAAIIESPLSSHLTVLCRREISSQTLVQVAICMKDDERKQLYVLVQGKDYSHDSAGQNLYNSLFYEFYRYAAQCGLKTVYLGRGNHALKKRLGANRFRVLNNWILTEDRTIQKQLDQVIEAARDSLRLTETEGSHEKQ